MMNVVGEKEVGHPEYDPDITSPLFTLASCPVDTRPEGAPRLWGRLMIEVCSGTLCHQIYGKVEIDEPHSCNFELNPDYTETLEKYGARISGVNEDGIVRMVEFPKNTFYVITGFLPQLASEDNNPHPVIASYLKSAQDYQKEKEA